ncbi:hypothetical protein HYT25_02555 [Candidatus Pacearchaeota archaeon]|nr:hypothetical protein [Candidatus Pacearchaeota archaeon]
MEYKNKIIILLGGGLLVLYGITSTFSTLIDKKFHANPLTQINIMAQDIIRQSSEDRTKKEYWNKIFGPDGYADTNHDGGIDFHEQSTALKRIDYDEQFIEGLSRFPVYNEFSLTQLERSIKSYEEERLLSRR